MAGVTSRVSLRELLDAATPGPWEAHRNEMRPDFWNVYAHAKEYGSSGLLCPVVMPPDARLIALAPDLAQLVLDQAELIRKTIYNPPGWSGPDVWWKDEADALLARVDRLGQEHA